jgi:hypothetical protein
MYVFVPDRNLLEKLRNPTKLDQQDYWSFDWNSRLSVVLLNLFKTAYQLQDLIIVRVEWEDD